MKNRRKINGTSYRREVCQRRGGAYLQTQHRLQRSNSQPLKPRIQQVLGSGARSAGAEPGHGGQRARLANGGEAVGSFGGGGGGLSAGGNEAHMVEGNACLFC
jgi:hypothetical protein